MPETVDDLPLTHIDDDVLWERWQTVGKEIGAHARVWARMDARRGPLDDPDHMLDQIRRLVAEHDAIDAELAARRSGVPA